MGGEIPTVLIRESPLLFGTLDIIEKYKRGDGNSANSFIVTKDN